MSMKEKERKREREKERELEKKRATKNRKTHVGELLDEVVVLEEDRACVVFWKRVSRSRLRKKENKRDRIEASSEKIQLSLPLARRRLRCRRLFFFLNASFCPPVFSP